MKRLILLTALTILQPISPTPDMYSLVAAEYIEDSDFAATTPINIKDKKFLEFIHKNTKAESKSIMRLLISNHDVFVPLTMISFDCIEKTIVEDFRASANRCLSILSHNRPLFDCVDPSLLKLLLESKYPLTNYLALVLVSQAKNTSRKRQRLDILEQVLKSDLTKDLHPVISEYIAKIVA